MVNRHSYFVIDNNDGNGPFKAELHTESADWYIIEGATLVSYHGNDEVLELGSCIETIVEGAFRDNTSLKSVAIGWRTVHIEPEAFLGCTSLQTVIMRSGGEAFWDDESAQFVTQHPLASIGDRAFKGCVSLKSVEFEEQVLGDWNTYFDFLRIGDEAFAGCTSLELMDLSYVAAWLEVGNRAFADCTSLEMVSLAEALGALADDAFTGCTSLASLAVPKELNGYDDETTAHMLESLQLLQATNPNLQVELLEIDPEWESYEVHAIGWTPMWTMRKFRARREVIAYRDVAGWWKGRPAAGLFRGFSNLSRVDLTGLDTSREESLACLFKGCTLLEAVDLSCLDTSQVTDLRQLFYGCSRRLTNLDLSCLDTSHVTTMAHLCHNCRRLERVNLAASISRRCAASGRPSTVVRHSRSSISQDSKCQLSRRWVTCSATARACRTCSVAVSSCARPTSRE